MAAVGVIEWVGDGIELTPTAIVMVLDDALQ
jgi:hypothetical protein